MWGDTGANGELQDLKSQLQELQSNPPATVPHPPITGEQFTEEVESNRPPHPSPNADFLNKPTIMLHDGSILAVSKKQENILILLGLIPQTHNILTSQFLGAVCKSNLTNNRGELESLIGEKIDTKGSTIRKTAAVLRDAGFTLSGSEGKGFLITGIK